jgi:hypothetical protein
MKFPGLLAAAAVAFAGSQAWASGAPGPTGPLMIDVDDKDGGFFVGSGFSSIKTTVEFEDLDLEFEQQAIALTVGRQFGRSWSLALSVGLILGGELEIEGDPDTRREFDIDQGFMANLQLVRQWNFGATRQWFVAGEVAGGVGLAKSAEEIGDEEFGSERVTGFDVRAGALFGRELADIVRPYGLVRGFVGPINWTLDGDDETATDKYFFQVGLGVVVDVPLGFSVGVEGGVLGEKRIAFGVSSRL